MKRAAAIISFVMALVLLGTALSSAIDRSNEAPDRMSAEFRHMGDEVAFYRDMREDDEAEHTMEFQALGGVAFLIAGLALWGKEPLRQPKEKPPSMFS